MSPSCSVPAGVDPHVGVGAARARLELEVAVGALAERFPSMTLIDDAPVFRHCASRCAANRESRQDLAQHRQRTASRCVPMNVPR